MQIISKTLQAAEGFASILASPEIQADPSEVLFLDIETTGISRTDSRVFLVGCACALPFETGGQPVLQMTQWFDDTGLGEKSILSSFLAFSEKFRICINYNGNRFDLPFLRARIEACGLLPLAASFLSMQSLDLYTRIAPFRRLLGLPDYRQQTVEEAMLRTPEAAHKPASENRPDRDPAAGESSFSEKSRAGFRPDIRQDSGDMEKVPEYDQAEGTQAFDNAESMCSFKRMDGSTLVETYKKYVALPSAQIRERICRHNEANVAGLSLLLSLTKFAVLEDPKISVRRAQANYYTDVDGRQAEELLVRFSLPDSLPIRICAGRDHCYLKIEGSSGVLKIPLYTGTLKYFYANYRDYYYLPAEDMAIHKYIASFVDKSRRTQAGPETCYTRKTSTYLPQWSLYRTPFFRKSYDDKELFFEFTDDLKTDREALSGYTTYVLQHILM